MHSPSFLQRIFPTQESNWGLLHCRWILYQLSCQGSPIISLAYHSLKKRHTEKEKETMDQPVQMSPQGVKVSGTGIFLFALLVFSVTLPFEAPTT